MNNIGSLYDIIRFQNIIDNTSRLLLIKKVFDLLIQQEIQIINKDSILSFKSLINYEDYVSFSNGSLITISGNSSKSNPYSYIIGKESDMIVLCNKIISYINNLDTKLERLLIIEKYIYKTKVSEVQEKYHISKTVYYNTLELAYIQLFDVLGI